MPVGERQPRVRARPDLGRRDDVEHRQRTYALGPVKRHPVGDPAAAIVARHREALEPQRRHRLHEVGRERTLGVRRMIGGRNRTVRIAVARQVGRHDREPPSQLVGAAVPHQVGLGVAVQHQQRRARATHPRVDRAAIGGEVPLVESVEHQCARPYSHALVAVRQMLLTRSRAGSRVRRTPLSEAWRFDPGSRRRGSSPDLDPAHTAAYTVFPDASPYWRVGY